MRVHEIFESITTDPLLNDQIEQRLVGDVFKNLWLDALDVVQRAGYISVAQLAAYLQSLYPDEDPRTIVHLVKQLNQRFDNVVAVQHGWFLWRGHKEPNSIKPPDPSDRWPRPRDRK